MTATWSARRSGLCKRHFINANSATAPGIVDADLNPVLTRSEVYSGVYGAPASHFMHSTNGNRGIACGLNNLQLIAQVNPRRQGKC